MTTTHPTASLHYCEGPSNKEYHAAIEPRDEGYIVTFAYGRRGQTLNTGTKTIRPVSLEEAERIFDKLIRSKLAKGYHHADAPADSSYRPSGREGQDTGIRCQLLNPIEESEIMSLIRSPRYCLQQKHDGRRLLVRKVGDEITGINRRGLVTTLPEAIREAVAQIPCDILIDGEAVGETLHAFDLLEFQGSCYRHRRFIDRFATLMLALPPCQESLRWISTVLGAQEKLEIFEELRVTGCEGVVFKDIDAPFRPDRPPTGGPPCCVAAGCGCRRRQLRCR